MGWFRCSFFHRSIPALHLGLHIIASWQAARLAGLFRPPCARPFGPAYLKEDLMAAARPAACTRNFDYNPVLRVQAGLGQRLLSNKPDLFWSRKALRRLPVHAISIASPFCVCRQGQGIVCCPINRPRFGAGKPCGGCLYTQFQLHPSFACAGRARTSLGIPHLPFAGICRIIWKI